MKQFDASSIKERLLTSLAGTTEWSQIVGDSATVSLVNSIAESSAEVIRYAENLLSEAKWDTAMNLSSYATMAQYLGYQPQKKVSSQGILYLSHDSGLGLLGTTYFTAEDLTNNLDAYTGNDVTIPQGSVFATISSPYVQFLSTESITYATGMKFVEVPVMQGIMSSQTTPVIGTAFEEILISDPLIEDASNDISAQFLTVTITPPGATAILATRYESIFMADETEYAYDLLVTPDLASLIFRFGDGITGKILPAGSTVTIQYASSLGLSGNVSKSYVVNGIQSNLAMTFYCSNITSILGGADKDTTTSIRSKAPTAYVLNGGSIITIEQYTREIESLPYVQNATVYSGDYYNPITLLTTNTILYSAIDTSGEDVSIAYPNFGVTANGQDGIVPTLLLGRNSPLDNPIYVSPEFLHVRYNITGQTTNKDAPALQSSIQTYVYSKYSTIYQEFDTTFDNSAITNDIVSTYSLSSTSTQLEAIERLLPSTFTVDPDDAIYYIHPFHFDPSYGSFYGGDASHPYCLKINIIFTCAECLDNSRTLFLVKSMAGLKVLYTCSLTTAVATGNYVIQFDGVCYPISISETSPTAYDVMDSIYTGLTGVSGYSYKMFPSGALQVTKPAGNISDSLALAESKYYMITVTGAATGAGTLTWGGGASGTVTISAIMSTALVAQAMIADHPTSYWNVSISASDTSTVRMEYTGIGSATTPTITAGATGVTFATTAVPLTGVAFYPDFENIYTIVQTAYIPTSYVTTKSFYDTNVKAGKLFAPKISATVTSIKDFKVPFYVDFDVGSLAPTDLANTELGNGVLYIPSTVNLGGGTVSTAYLTFSAGSITDDNVIIEVIAQPTSETITPYYNNNIVKIGQTLQNSTTVDDVVINLSSREPWLWSSIN